MADTLQPQAPHAEASVHAQLRELAEKAWREHGIRLDHVYLSWIEVGSLSEQRLDITSVQITSRTYPRKAE